MSDDVRRAGTDDAHGHRDAGAREGDGPAGDDFGAWFDREFGLEPPTGGGTDARSSIDTPTSVGTSTGTAAGTSAGTSIDAPGPSTAVAAHVVESGPTEVAAAPDVGQEEPSQESVVARAARRVVRRPLAWWRRPWDTDRVVRVLVTSATLVTTTVVMMLVVHLNPFSPGDDLVFDQTTPTGGDMGAHVWAPAFLRDHFLPNFQISGWSMDWYGGLPLYRFYMVIPALAIVALDVVLPYGVAFKLVAVSGLVLFPLACWAFGRLAAFRHPIPELFSVAALCFLLDESFSIYGGNVKSTMAGEYSFSISLTLAMVGLGLLARGLRTGQFRVWTAVVLSLAAVSHGIVLIFVAVAATILCLVWLDRGRLVFAVTTGVTTLLLSAWWVGPFLFGHEFMTDMKYGFRPEGADDSFWDMFFPLAAPLDFLITALAVVGFVAMILRRNLNGTAIGLICLAFVALVYLTRDSLPLIGLLWNPRLLPFVYLTRYMLMVIGALELITWFVNAVRDRRASTEPTALEGAAATGVITLSCLLVFGWMYETLPFDGRVTEGESSVYAWGPLRKGPESGRAVADGWTRYNMLGYEGRPKYYEYNEVVTTMGELGETRGCGRALWENNSANGEYGTTMSLMLLPHWTDGCIGSMEGLFFEASGTTPYHFLTAAAMSEQSSNPVRQLRYANNDAEVGVRHMRDLGVRYVMVRTEAAKAEAEAQDDLVLVASSGPWDIYELEGAAIVEPLSVQPVVVEERGGDQRERNLEVGTSWFQRPEDWAAIPADDGPASWQRVPVEIDLEARVGEPGDRSRNVDYVVPTEAIEAVPLTPITVSEVEIEQQSISFEVDQVGVPVLVRVSYFPTWEVEGAEGPYRVAPNHMVVVPTANEVTLSYAKTPLDWFFYSLTIFGIGLCVYWRRRGDVVYDSERPNWRGSPPAEQAPDREAEAGAGAAADTLGPTGPSDTVDPVATDAR
jgi:hypothetical protein